jgi:hypothetical protein
MRPTIVVMVCYVVDVLTDFNRLIVGVVICVGMTL